MADLVLNVTERVEKGSTQVKRLRKEGFIPGVIYGTGNDNVHLKVSMQDLLHLLHGHAAENLILVLKIKRSDNKEEVRNVLIRELQKNPMSDEFVHMDFMEISMTEKLEVSVPIETIGDAVGVIEQGGVVEHVLREIEIECMPKDVPELLEVDITELRIGDALLVKDVPLPPDVSLVTDPEETLVMVVVPRIIEEEEEVEAEEEAVTEPELIGREKGEDEGEGAKE